MKTPRWFTRNYLFSHLRITTAVTLMSAAAAMAFVAGSDRLLTVSSPSTDLSQDREAKGKIAGDPDVVLRRPGRRVRGVQIRGADLSGQRDPAIDGAERQEDLRKDRQAECHSDCHSDCHNEQ